MGECVWGSEISDESNAQTQTQLECSTEFQHCFLGIPEEGTAYGLTGS